MPNNTPLTSRVIETKLLNWKEFQFIQPEGFKDLSAQASDKLKKSVLDNQFVQPFYVWIEPGTGIQFCLDGYHRVGALNQLQSEGVDIPAMLPATLMHCEDRKDAAGLVLVYSSMYAKITESGLLDFARMYDLNLEDLSATIDLPGMDMSILDHVELKAEDDEYEIPDQVETDIIEGDVFEIGEHRLMCGSATDQIAWAKLMGEELADLVITDPPYNVAYEGKTDDKLTIMNDKMDDEAFYKFLFDAFDLMAWVSRPGAAWYVWHADSEGANFRTAMKAAGIPVRQCLIWVKNSIVMGRQDYQWKHEPCLYGWKEGASHHWYSDRKQSTILEFDRPTRSSEHPTMKPVPLIGYQVENSSKVGDIVVDGFGGSGTTMVACEQLKRKCRMMELDPKYCQVIIDRMRLLVPGITVLKNGQVYQPYPLGVATMA